MPNRPYYDDSDLNILLEYVTRALVGGHASDEDQRVMLQVVAAVLGEVVGPPPADPQNEATASIVATLDPDLSSYISLGVRRRDAIIWKAFGFTAEQTRGWLNNNVTMSEALTWKRVKPENYHEWVAIGVNEMDAREWESRNYMPTDAKYWGKANTWDTLERLRWLGPAEQVAPLFNEHKLTIDDIVTWASTDIPLSDVATWAKKGYTVRQAVKLHEQGKSPHTVKDLRGGEPFATPSWKRIADAARKNGWIVSEPERVTSGRYATRVSVQFERNGKKYFGLFGTTGQFRSVVTNPIARWYPNAHDPGRIRTIDEFVRALHQPTK